MAHMASTTLLDAARSPVARPAPRRLAASPLALWSAFVLVHVVLAVIVLSDRGYYSGDVLTIYRPWAEFARGGYGVVGIGLPWVYPIGALGPIMLPIVFGPAAYGAIWVLMVTALDAAAFAVLTAGRHPRCLWAAWWWMAFMLLLGPISISRLDAVSAPIVMVALLWLSLRRQLAVVLITVATWIKVWPAAVLLGLMIALRGRWRILARAAATSAVFIIVALVYGAGWHVFSFIGMQAARGVQVEAPVALPWMWAAALHVPGNVIYYDVALNTFQISGPGAGEAASLMTPLLGLAVVAIAILGIRAVRHGASPVRLVPLLSLSLVATMIVFNKVGSPQYMSWLIAPVVAGIVYQGRAFRRPAVAMLAIGALTQLFYPYLYDWLLAANPVMLLVLTARNAGVCLLLAWSIRALWRSARAGDRRIPDLRPTAVWPFRLREPSGG